MAIDTTSPRTRRAVLMGALGGAVAAAAASVERANPVSATNGDPVLVGHTYTATTLTEIDATGTSGFYATSDSGTGVAGSSSSGDGVAGGSSSGSGVSGSSNSNAGIYGYSLATDKPGIVGRSLGGNTGVQGLSGSAAPASPAKTGVFGYARQDGTAMGVMGQTTAGRGVFGRATTGVGVYGKSDSGRGGQFSGGKAQLRLIPSSAATHPTAGATGDLFLDKFGRLWFCKGGAAWAKLA